MHGRLLYSAALEGYKRFAGTRGHRYDRLAGNRQDVCRLDLDCLINNREERESTGSRL